MEFEILEEPVRFRLNGLSGVVTNHNYGEVGVRLMDQMWKLVKENQLKNKGINHWVYLPGDQMYVGVELLDKRENISLEEMEFTLSRYAKHVHIGPYQELPRVWQTLMSELANRGEMPTMPSLEIYGHACEEDDGSKAETTILIGLRDQPGSEQNYFLRDSGSP